VVNNFGDEWRITPCTVNRVGECIAIDEERAQIVGHGIVEQGEAEDVAVIGRAIAVAHLRENQADVAFLQRVVLFVDGGAKFPRNY